MIVQIPSNLKCQWFKKDTWEKASQEVGISVQFTYL